MRFSCKTVSSSVPTVNDAEKYTRDGATKGIAKPQFANDIKGAIIVPISHIPRLLGTILVELADHHVDKMMDDILLRRQRLGRKVVAERLAHLSMIGRVAYRKQRIGFPRGRLVPRAFDEQPLARASAVNVFPGLWGVVGEFVGGGAHYAAVFVVQLLDFVEAAAAEPVGDEP